MNSIQILKEHITVANKIAILGHENPDMDSLASMIALKRTIINNSNLFGEKKIDLIAQEVQIDSLYDSIIKDEIIADKGKAIMKWPLKSNGIAIAYAKKELIKLVKR